MRNLGLDLLRMLAVALVMIRHMHLDGNSDSLLKRIQHGGWIGVDLFFVLSGYLIAGLLFSEYKRRGKVDVTRFLIRRGFKIYPPFWALLFITITSLAVQNSMISSRSLFCELVFIQNYGAALWNHTWSLAVEEHFYFLLAGWIAISMRGTSAKVFSSLPLVFCLVTTACLAARVVAWRIHPDFGFKAHVFPTHLRIDSLLFGALLSYATHYRGLGKRMESIPAWILVLAGGALVSPSFMVSLEKECWLSTIGFSMTYLGAGCLVLSAVRIQSSRSLILKGVGALGAMSYSIYLWHMPMNNLAAWISERCGLGFSGYMAGYVGGTLVIGVLMARLIEVPALRLRSRLFPDQSSSK